MYVCMHMPPIIESPSFSVFRSDQRGRNPTVSECALSVLSRPFEGDPLGQRSSSRWTPGPLPGRLPAPLYMVPANRRNSFGFIVIMLNAVSYFSPQWIASRLAEFAPRICQRRGVDLKDYFSEEMKICQDLVKLLPSKIDRMNYLGEGGLSL